LVVALSISTALLGLAQQRASVARTEAFRTVQMALASLDQMAETVQEQSGADRAAAGRSDARASQIVIAYCAEVTKRFAGDETMHEAVAKAHRSAGRARVRLGQPNWIADYRQSIQLYEKIAARRTELLWLRAGLIGTLTEFADQLETHGDPAGRRSALGRAVQVADGLIGNPNADLHCFRIGLQGPFNSLAWALVRRPGSSAGDATAAVRLAKQAVAWDRTRAAYWNTLGAAHFRSGDWAAARTALEESMKRSGGGGPCDWFFVAMLAQRQGRPGEARVWYDRAVAVMPSKAGCAIEPDLWQFYSEASLALGLKAEPKGELTKRGA
jgi:tetratricopeptide (TPR) repeat protein